MLKIKSGVVNALILCVLVSFHAGAQHKLVKTKVNDNVTVFVPKEWLPMNEMDFIQRYPSVRAPLAAFTNDARTADFSVNISATQWPDTNAAMAKGFFKSSIMNMFDQVRMLDEGIRKIKDKEYVYFEFESRISGNQGQVGYQDTIAKYTYIQYLLLPGQTLVFSFNAPLRMKDEWKETAAEMMEKIVVK